MRGSNQQGVVLLYYVYAWCGHDGGRTLRVNPLACLRFFIETIMGEIQVKNVSFFEIYTVAENSYLRIPSTQSEKIYKTRNCYSFWKCDFLVFTIFWNLIHTNYLFCLVFQFWVCCAWFFIFILLFRLEECWCTTALCRNDMLNISLSVKVKVVY